MIWMTRREGERENGERRAWRTAGRLALTAAAVALVLAAGLGAGAGVGAKAEGDAARAVLPPWNGPAVDFKIVDGRIMGPWWQGGGLGVVYYTGPGASKGKAFEEVGRAIAQKLGRPYLEIHKEDLQSSAEAVNGILAYPDGTARVQLFLMPGGNAYTTMSELAGVSNAKAEREKFAAARKVPQGAFRTGMNYVGCCGGFYVGASGCEKAGALFTDWGLWPGKFKDLGPGQHPPFPDVTIDGEAMKSPLFKAVKNGVLADMYFNGGPVGPESGVPGTTYFGKYVSGNMPELIGDWFCIAYQRPEDGLCGRCVMATGHPEVKHKDFLMAMAEYAVSRLYEVPRKYIEPAEPVAGVVGDDQMQYYCVKAEAGKKLTVTLAGLEEHCGLYLRQGLPPSFAINDSSSTDAVKGVEKVRVGRTRAGDYFIGVHGRHRDRNGAHYTLSVTME